MIWIQKKTERNGEDIIHVAKAEGLKNPFNDILNTVRSCLFCVVPQVIVVGALLLHYGYSEMFAALVSNHFVGYADNKICTLLLRELFSDVSWNPRCILVSCVSTIDVSEDK